MAEKQQGNDKRTLKQTIANTARYRAVVLPICYETSQTATTVEFLAGLSWPQQNPLFYLHQQSYL